ncbi:MAG: tRNA pseudouridine(13) synthase TruD [Polyangiaceae bacterium]|nr:tRNA pseudouridine(13) synthase TruD [Polyangiaceae bacterium]
MSAPPPPPAQSDLPAAVIRRAPEDFVVEELPAYSFSGRGEHVIVTFRKTGRTTPDAVRALALALGSDPRAAGFAGMKDRHAVTTQAASFHVPLGRDPEPLLQAAAIPGLEVLAVTRPDNKLKPGHLAGNRFRITLRDVDPTALLGSQAARERLERSGREGVPNAFGPQRFGRDGQNPARAIAWIEGRERGPRDRREQRLIFSALQSLWFNEVLAARERDGTWATALPGDLAKRHDSGGLFQVPLEGPDVDEARARAAALEISATGPMFGTKMRWPLGEPAALERAVIERAIGDPRRLDALAHAGEGTRRPLRLEVRDMAVTFGAPGRHAAPSAPSPVLPGDDERAIVVSFVLPKGGYATTLLGRSFRLIDASARGAAASSPEPEAQEEEEGPAGSPSPVDA